MARGKSAKQDLGRPLLSRLRGSHGLLEANPTREAAREEREREEARQREVAQAKALAKARARSAAIFKFACVGVTILAITPFSR